MHSSSRIYAVLQAGQAHVDTTGKSAKNRRRSKSPPNTKAKDAEKKRLAEQKAEKVKLKKAEKQARRKAKKATGSISGASSAASSAASSPSSSRSTSPRARLQKAGNAAKATNRFESEKASSAASSPSSSRSASPQSFKSAGNKVKATNRFKSPKKPVAKPPPLARQGAVKDLTSVNEDGFKPLLDLVARYRGERTKNYDEYAQAEKEVTDCIEARKAALRTLQTNAQKNADKVIDALEAAVKKNKGLLDDLQGKLSDGQGDQNEIIAMQSKLDEAARQKDALEMALEQARNDAEREKAEQGALLQAELDKEKASHAADAAKDSAEIAMLQKRMDEVGDEADARLQQETKDNQKEFEKMQQKLKDDLARKVEEYEKVHTQVCELLKQLDEASDISRA